MPSRGNRLICYCESCRAFVERFDRGARLDVAGGSDLLQVDPKHVKIRQGAQHLRWTKLTHKGPMRWYAACCGTPMANTLPVRALAFASFQVADITPKDTLPDVTARVHLKGAKERVEEPLGSVWPLMIGLVGRSLTGLLSGAWKRNPFFDARGKPIAQREDPPQASG